MGFTDKSITAVKTATYAVVEHQLKIGALAVRTIIYYHLRKKK